MGKFYKHFGMFGLQERIIMGIIYENEFIKYVYIYGFNTHL